MCSHFPFLKTTVEKIADGGRNIPMWNLFGIGGKGFGRGVIHRISTADVYQFKRNVQALTCRGMYSIFTISYVYKKNWKIHCPMHYVSIPIKRGQLEFWARFIPLPPFWSSLIISDKIFGDCQLRSFTFEWYLGTSWTQSSSEAKISCSSSSLQTGCE